MLKNSPLVKVGGGNAAWGCLANRGWLRLSAANLKWQHHVLGLEKDAGALMAYPRGLQVVSCGPFPQSYVNSHNDCSTIAFLHVWLIASRPRVTAD